MGLKMKESHDARKDPKTFLCWVLEVYGSQYVCDLNIEQVILAYEHQKKTSKARILE